MAVGLIDGLGRRETGLQHPRLDGDGELSDAEKKKETMKLKGAVLQAFAAKATYAGNIPGPKCSVSFDSLFR